MHVDEVCDRRENLKNDIRRLLEDFRSATGVVPFVDVEWPSVQMVGSQVRAFAPPTVTVSLRL